MKQATKSRPSLDQFLKGIQAGERVVLAQAITLVESTLPSDQHLASQLIEKILPATGKSVRIGISGTPGVGKSSFIEAFGVHLTKLGKKVAVLTIDPSSQLTKGSILGDKTRMSALAVNPNAFIRPSSSGDAVGGVAHKTREAMLLCEAAGYDIILIETVGVGQSEVAVKNMTDLFLLLIQPGSGDELQSIKKGIMEMADVVVITKADGDLLLKARQSQADFQQGINLLYQYSADPAPKVLLASVVTNSGIEDVYNSIEQYIKLKNQDGAFQLNRSRQNVSYMHEYFNLLIKYQIAQSSTLQHQAKELEEKVLNNEISSGEAAKKLLESFTNGLRAAVL